MGAHAGGYNLVSTGIAVLGSFMSTPISAASHRSLERLLAWKLSLHGVPSAGRATVKVNSAGAVYSRFPANARVSLPRIAGHRDGDSTDCPGDVLYRELGGVRSAVEALAPHPVRLTLALVGPPAPTPAASPVEAPPARQTPVLSGSLSLLDGTPIAGAPVQLQARTVSRRGERVDEHVLAELLTDAQGLFQTPASIPGVLGKRWLRALCPGTPSSGAAVSDSLQVELAALSPLPAPAPSSPAAAPAGT